MNPYERFVSEYAQLARDGKEFPLAKFPRCPRPQVPHDAPKVLIFSPHPDDEVIVGALPLRLLRKSRWNVLNVAVTLGSRRDRQPQRLEEVKACCDCIGFGLLPTAPNGLEGVNLPYREQDPVGWARHVQIIVDLLTQHQPRVILFPHHADWNETHLGTHILMLDALQRMPAGFDCNTVETEYWRAMDAPNLMLEVGLQDLSDLMTALTFHVGEVKRNPYHLSLPAWMVDNARRGSELIGTQGGTAAEFPFATLYRVRRWRNGNFENFFRGGKWLRSHEDPAELFKL